MEPPLDRSTTWPYVDGEPGPFHYARNAHPVGVEAEQRLGELDGGEALLFPSGMGATTALVLGLLSPGSTVALAHDAYYGTCSMTRRARLRPAPSLCGSRRRRTRS